MSMNIKNSEVERLAAEVAAITGESKTEAIRRALQERRARLSLRIADGDKSARLRRFLEQEAWPILPKKEAGRRLTRKEEERILGFGKEGF
jgi:antitoxin VapB